MSEEALMNTFVKSTLILLLMINAAFVMTNEHSTSTTPTTLGEYMSSTKYAHRRALNREILKAEVNRSPAVEPFTHALAVEDFSNYRRPAVIPNY
jgi:hypothetical protein